MTYRNFNGDDAILHGLLNLIGKPVEEYLKKIFTTEQLNITGAVLVYTLARNTLSKYLNGYNLYPGEVAMLRQYVFTIQDEEVGKKVSAFLQSPSIITAREAFDELSKSEMKHFAPKVADGMVDQKQPVS